MDLRFALRGLRRNPGFAAVAILTLTIGIGASAAAFSVVNAVLLKPLPYPDADRVVELREVDPQGGVWSVAPATLLDWQDQNQVFTGIAAINRYPDEFVNLTGVDTPLRIRAHRVSSNFFRILGVEAMLGRTFVPEDDEPGGANVAVISYGLWLRAFGSDPELVGRSIHLSEESYRVIGIMPPEFFFRDGGPEIWKPRPFDADARSVRQTHLLHAVARLRYGVSLEQARSEMNRIARALAEQYPAPGTDVQAGQFLTVQVLPLQEQEVRAVRPTILLLSGGTALIMLIVWVNLTNLLLVRADARMRELSVRVAIGAGRMRMVRLLLAECLVLAVLGGIGGLLLGRWLVALVVTFAPAAGGGAMGLATNSIPMLSRASIDATVVSLIAITCFLTSLACGLGPAIRAARTSRAVGLQVSGSRQTPRGNILGRQLLVAVEVALALVLLIGVGLLGRALGKVLDVPLGFDPANAQVMRAELAQPRYASLESGAPGTSDARWTVVRAQRDLVRNVVERLEAHPSVEIAGAVSFLPIQGATNRANVVGIQLPGNPGAMNRWGGPPLSFLATATPGYFRAMEISLVAGRRFTWGDDEAAAPVAIVDQAFVDAYGPGDPLGARLRILDGAGWRDLRIVGVVGSVLQLSYSNEFLAEGMTTFPTVYVPYLQPAAAYNRLQIGFHMTTNFVARHGGAAESVSAAMRESLETLDPETPIEFVASLKSYVGENLADRRFYTLTLGILSTVALILALMGLYGVLAFHVGQRVHEIGIRIALGASTSGVVRMVVGEGWRMALLGALLGLAGAMVATKTLSAWLYEVSPTDPTVLAGLCGLMLAVTTLASWVPARRAASVDPVRSLRVD